MDYHTLAGKEVLSKQACVIGKVYEIEIDTKTWRVTHIDVDLNKTTVEKLGLTKHRLERVKATIPTETIEAISDHIILSQAIEDLKNTIKVGS